MKFVKYILYKPYILLLGYLTSVFIYISWHSSSWEIFKDAVFVALYLLFLRFIFRFLQNSLFKLVNRFSFFAQAPDNVLSGYLYILLLFQPIVMILLALVAKIFIWERKSKQNYTDDYGNEVTRIKSLTPTIILSRKENGEEEHLVMTKLKKKPKKIIYE